MRIPTLPLARLCALRVSRSQLARHYSSPSNSSAEKAAKEEVPFSESPAYFGRDRKILDEPIYIPDYYDSNRYRMKKFMSAVLSTMAVVIYVAYFREPNDFDEIYNSPPYLLNVASERRYLKEKRENLKKEGKNTSVVDAELQHVDVKEEALKLEYERDLEKANDSKKVVERAAQ